MSFKPRFPLLLPFLFFILWGHTIPGEAKKHRKVNPGSPQQQSPQSPPTHSGSNSKTSNVMDFGAAGDGKTDDSKAFENAWNDACKNENPTVLVPAGYTFLLGPVELSGKSCSGNFFFQLNGKLIASTSRNSWSSHPLQWLDFTNVQGLTIQGTGNIDGQGSVWWNGGISGAPTALRVADSQGVIVTGISISNSPKAHLKFDSCDGVRVESISINSPSDSPNTDGIHLQNTVNVEIRDSQIASGDDNISIQTGCEGITIERVTSVNGHGISIGGLGKGGSVATVSGVTVRDCTFRNTLNGARLKTWKGGSGRVNNVSFSDIQVTGVANAIVIDQYYTDSGDDKQMTDSKGVAISGVTFSNIHGSYTNAATSIACSSGKPCQDIILANIELEPSSSNAESTTCYKATVKIEEPVTPSLNCNTN